MGPSRSGYRELASLTLHGCAVNHSGIFVISKERWWLCLFVPSETEGGDALNIINGILDQSDLV